MQCNRKIKNSGFFLKPTLSFAARLLFWKPLGYHLLLDHEKAFLEQFFAQVPIVHIEDGIIEVAITLKQEKKMSLADAIIGATALYYNYPLVTNNEVDFQHIKGLSIINPLK